MKAALEKFFMWLVRKRKIVRVLRWIIGHISLPVVSQLAVLAGLNLPENLRFVFFRKLAEWNVGNPAAQKRFMHAARQLTNFAPRGLTSEACSLLALFSSDPQRAIQIVEQAAHRTTNLHVVELMSRYELGDYKGALAAFRAASYHVSERIRNEGALLHGAYAAGMCREPAFAVQLFGRQFGIEQNAWHLFEKVTFGAAGPAIQELLISGMAERLEAKLSASEHKSQDMMLQVQQIAISLSPPLTPASARLAALGDDGLLPKVGVFFLNSVQALGHAILDPYHFLAMNRGRFDHFVFLGPPLSSYSPGSRACVEIIAQYGTYIEVHDDITLNLSWMYMGEQQVGPVTIVVENYWSLLRSVVHRSLDPDDGFLHNAWHVTIPERFSRWGEIFAAQSGVDLARPIVVLHVRHHAYHGIRKQSYRDASVERYEEAIRHLLGAGYQVIRIGDTKMPRMESLGEGYFELPFLDGYAPFLDPFFISRAQFMIGCQSGPCAYARALGVPLLSINAVYHYTLLPTSKEMVCFKRYLRNEAGAMRLLTHDEALSDERLYHIDNSHQLEVTGLTVEEASGAEIVAAVKDMIAWLEDPAAALTARQQEFHNLVIRTQSELRDAAPLSLRIPLGDYLGAALPGYRISPTVDELRYSRSNGIAGRVAA